MCIYIAVFIRNIYTESLLSRNIILLINVIKVYETKSEIAEFNNYTFSDNMCG